MQNIWFTSDTHFGHANLVRHNRRQFNNIEETDSAIINNWNTKVKHNDLVYHLGDFAWYTPEKYFNQLHGQIILIKGNHDGKKTVKLPFARIESYLELKDPVFNKIVLCHYPLLSWNKHYYGTIHLHGHCHGSLPTDNSRRLDIGVDCHNFQPLLLEEIHAIMKERDMHVIDHHRSI
jgi:calcineurin-like phosphoesterase family protein